MPFNPKYFQNIKKHFLFKFSLSLSLSSLSLSLSSLSLSLSLPLSSLFSKLLWDQNSLKLMRHVFNRGQISEDRNFFYNLVYLVHGEAA
jgi:hypothetical protein